MSKARQIFGEEQRRAVNAAVAEAESRTAAEIVPVVADASGRYDRAEDIAGLWLGGITLTLVWLFVPDASDAPGDWSGVAGIWKLIAMLGALVGGFIFGAVIAAYVPTLRRLFTPRAQMRNEVAARARQVFFDRTVHHTENATGVLVFVSLYERRAAILADQQTLEALGQPALDTLRDELIVSLRAGAIPDALAATIRATGEKLAPALPQQQDDTNELPDALIVID
jgi:putative membrane protein